MSASSVSLSPFLQDEMRPAQISEFTTIYEFCDLLPSVYFLLTQAAEARNSSISRWNTMKFGMNIHDYGLFRINCNNFGDPHNFLYMIT